MANNIAVSITADVVDLQAKRAVMSAELKAATKDLNDFAKQAAATGTTEELRAGMLASADAAEKARAKIALVTQEIKEFNKVPEPSHHGFEGLTASISETGVRLRETIGLVGEFRAALMEIGEVLIAAFALEKIHEFAEKMGEAAEKTVHLAETFGMTVGQVQQLGGVATATGIDIDSIVKGMGILDKNMVNSAGSATTAGNALKAVGIAANDGRSQMELLEGVADKFKSMDDGPKKVALAMALFGKSGKDLIPILNLGSEGIAEINRKSEEYGVVNEQAAEKGAALAESMNEQKLAMAGVSNVLADALAPMLKTAADGFNALIKAFIDSYREGGIVKEVFTAIQEVVGFVGTVIEGLAEIFKTLWEIVQPIVSDIGEIVGVVFGIQFGDHMKTASNWMNLFKDIVVVAKDVIIVAIEIIGSMIERLMGYLKAMAIVADDAFHLKWGAIQSDWNRGMTDIENRAVLAANRIKSAMDEAAKAIAAAAKGEALPGVPGETGIKLPKGGDGGDLGFTGGGHKSHQKKAKEGNVVSEWEEELTTAKTAFAMLQEEQGTYESYSLEKEAEFWRGKINLTKAGTKDREEVEKKWLAAMEALRNQGNAKALEAIKAQEAQSVEAAKNEAALSKIALQEKMEDIDAAQKAGRISATQALSEKRDINQKMLQLDIDLAQAEKTATIAALQAELAQEKLKPQQIKQIQDEILKQTQKFNDQIVLMNRKKDLELKKDDDAVAQNQQRVLQQTYQGFAQNIAKLVTLQQGFVTTMRGLWNNLVGVVEQAVTRMLTLWITSLVQKEAVGKAFHMKQVLIDAKQAAAGAFAAVAHIPIIGPILAPIAAAAAFAGTMAFASAEGGWDVPGGTGPGVDGRGGIPTIVHPQEMVLPAPLAGSFRSMFASGGLRSPANDGFGSDSSGGGDVHLHLHGDIIHNPQQLRRWFEQNDKAVGAGIRKYARQGGR